MVGTPFQHNWESKVEQGAREEGIGKGKGVFDEGNRHQVRSTQISHQLLPEQLSKHLRLKIHSWVTSLQYAIALIVAKDFLANPILTMEIL